MTDSTWIELDTHSHDLEPGNTLKLSVGGGLTMWLKVADVDGCRVKVKPIEDHDCWNEVKNCVDICEGGSDE